MPDLVEFRCETPCATTLTLRIVIEVSVVLTDSLGDFIGELDRSSGILEMPSADFC